MIKVVMPSSFNFDQQVMSLVDVHSRGIDNSWLKKSAAVLTKELSDIRPTPGTAYVHLIALGDAETYGLNRNGDSFPKSANEKYHDTFVKHAKWYHNHKNKPARGDKVYGTVKCSAYNPTMKRVELIVGISEKDDPDSIHKLANGEDLPVSMACVLDPEYPVLTKSGYRPISLVVPGDEVWTKEGRWRKVTRINRRDYTGEAVKLHMNGVPGTLCLTADHPMYATVFQSQNVLKEKLCAGSVQQKAIRYFKDPQAFEDSAPGWTHAEHLEAGDRLFYTPVTSFPGRGAIDCTDLATLMGFYLAEGSLAYNKDRACTIRYTVNSSDSALRLIPQTVHNLYPGITCTLTPHRSSKVCININVSNTELAEFMREFVGAGCRNKQVCPELFNASRTCKLAFIGSWLDGDGFIDKKGIHWSMASRSLALQLRDLLASMGIPASIYMIDHAKCPTSGKENSGEEYTVNVAHLERLPFVRWSKKAREYSEDAPAQGSRTKPAAMRKCFNGMYAYRVSTVEKYSVVKAPVYNVEVEEDESYSLGGFISHNCAVPFDICTVCGNRAKTAAEYCRHIKDSCGQLTKEGVQIGMINTQPKFFDISKVHRNADRIAFSLRKVASAAPILGTDLAEMYHITEPSFLIKDAVYHRRLALLEKLAKLEKQIEGEIKANPSMRMVADGLNAPVKADLGKVTADKLPAALGKLASDSVTLPMPDFFRMVMGSRFNEIEADLPAAQECLPGMFSGVLKTAEEFMSGIGDYEPADAPLPALIRDVLVKVGRQSSLSGTAVQDRMLTRALHKSSNVFVPNKPLKPGSEIGKILAVEYARYKLAALDKMSDPSVIRLSVLQDFGN